MNIIQFVQFLVIAPPELPPWWLWVIIAIVFIFGMILLGSTQLHISLPKRKAKDRSS